MSELISGCYAQTFQDLIFEGYVYLNGDNIHECISLEKHIFPLIQDIMVQADEDLSGEFICKQIQQQAKLRYVSKQFIEKGLKRLIDSGFLFQVDNKKYRLLQ